MKVLLFLSTFLLLLISCNKEDDKKNIPFSREDLIGIWSQKDTIKVFSTDPNTNIQQVLNFHEIFYFKSNDSFNIVGELFLKASDRGVFEWNENKKEIIFTGDPPIIIIGGIPYPTGADPQIWKWEILSFKDNVLEIYFHIYDNENKKYLDSPRKMSYIKQ